MKLNSGTFDKEDLEILKSTKTVFLYRADDDVEALEEAIQSVWTYTEISFIPYNEYKSIDFDNTSVFSISGINTNTMNTSSGMNYDNTKVYLNLWMMVTNKKGKQEKKSFCRIELHPTFKDYSYFTSGKKNNAFEYAYTNATLKNWKPVFLKAYLKNVNDLLTNQTERWLYANDQTDELKKLAKNTLYIPDYLFVKFNAMTGDESSRLNVDKIMKSYPFKYEVMSADELSEKALKSSEPMYFIVYVKSSTDKYLAVYNSETGDMLYGTYKGVSYNVKKSDFKNLAQQIRR